MDLFWMADTRKKSQMMSWPRVSGDEGKEGKAVEEEGGGRGEGEELQMMLWPRDEGGKGKDRGREEG
jgi:hypothetical protein